MVNEGNVLRLAHTVGKEERQTGTVPAVAWEARRCGEGA